MCRASNEIWGPSEPMKPRDDYGPFQRDFINRAELGLEEGGSRRAKEGTGGSTCTSRNQVGTSPSALPGLRKQYPLAALTLLSCQLCACFQVKHGKPT